MSKNQDQFAAQLVAMAAMHELNEILGDESLDDGERESRLSALSDRMNRVRESLQ